MRRKPATSRNGCRLRIGAAVACVCILAACASTPAARPPVKPEAALATTLGPGDTFEVMVYGENDLSGKHRVSDDGSINYPLVGRIDVAGLEAVQVSDRIRNELVARQILRAPTVSVTIVDQVSKRISVLGAVARPGGYPYVRGLTALQAIGAAGGLSALAQGDSTVLTRRVGGSLRRFNLQVESITEGQSEDVPLEAGDILFVPERIF